MRRDGAQPVSRPFAALPACMTVLMRLRVGRWDVTWLLDPEQQKRPRVAVQFVFSPLSAESFSEMVKKTIQIYLRVQISSTRCLFLQPFHSVKTRSITHWRLIFDTIDFLYGELINIGSCFEG
eukprot:s3745_g5.t1